MRLLDSRRLDFSSGRSALAKKVLRPEALAGAVLWQDPGNITSRDLYYGSGGEKDQPRGPFTFEKEDLDGSNPKFVVRDSDGVKWKVKLGTEARPETAASRLVWAVGYFTDEDYFLPDFQVGEMPAHLHRGQALVTADGSIHNARLKRSLKGQEKLGTWSWRGPAGDARPLNGLRVIMALIDNWDLKDENNSSIYQYKGRASYLRGKRSGRKLRNNRQRRRGWKRKPPGIRAFAVHHSRYARICEFQNAVPAGD